MDGVVMKGAVEIRTSTNGRCATMTIRDQARLIVAQVVLTAQEARQLGDALHEALITKEEIHVEVNS